MTEIVKTTCYMCIRGCGMDAYVEQGRMVKAEGMREHLISQGGLCPKGLAAVQYEYDPGRLLHPLKRTGQRGEGKWQPISWDEAIAITARELQRTVWRKISTLL
jgi:anaerobic selenocysteine-containing dehydrogenase